MSPSPRFPPTPPTPSQNHATEEAERLVRETFKTNFILKDSSGALLGPFSVLYYTPQTFIPFLEYNHALGTHPLLTAKERELAILVTTSVMKAAYVKYAHSRIGVQAGLDKGQVDEALEGRTPGSLSAREEAVFEVAVQAARGFGRVEEKVGRAG